MSDALLQIACLLDGKPGHQNQVLGLVEAIARVRPAEVVRVNVDESNRGLRSLRYSPPELRKQPSIDLWIAAGHRTHVPLLAFSKRFGGKSVLLMKPSLPTCFFDLCLIPEADGIRRASANVVSTRGVLNRIIPSSNKNREFGLIMLGGPSAHFDWSDEAILSQVETIVARSPDTSWTIGTSRRTPDALIDSIRSRELDAQLILANDVGPDWLPGQYASAGTIWVSEDSVSMTYESVTSGACVGILELVAPRPGRVTRAIGALVDTQQVTRFSEWRNTSLLSASGAILHESARTAEIVLSRMVGVESTRRAA